MAIKVMKLGANTEEQLFWNKIHSKKKYVFSHSIKNSANSNTTYINDNIIESMTELKEQSGKDIWLYGGSGLITSFINLALIDEFRLSVHPIVLCQGKPLFGNIHKRMYLTLSDTKTFKSGVVQLIYGWDGK